MILSWILVSARPKARGGLSIYPNPSNEFVNLDNSYADTIDYLISNLQGAVLLKGEISGYAQMAIDFKDWGRGVYFVYLRSTTGFLHCQKMVVSH